MLNISNYPARKLTLADFSSKQLETLKSKLQTQLVAIRIYGFTGTGKGSLSISLNKKLNIPYYESSPILRGATYVCLQEKIDPIPENISNIYSKIKVIPTPQNSLVIEYNNKIIPRLALKSAEVDALVPTLAKYRSIFYELYYHSITKQKSSMILDGRGYNTPYITGVEADGYKVIYIFLDCSTEVRANRYLSARNPDWSELDIEEKTKLLNSFQIGVVERDEKDMKIWETQNIGIIHPDSGYLDTSEMNFEEVENTALNFIYNNLI